MTEIKTVKIMDVDKEESKAKDPNEFMIETSHDGYNSGRTYYLQAESSASCQSISSKLSDCAAAALEAANARTAFEQAQQRVAKVYIASWFQNCVAILIIAVMRSPPASTPVPILLRAASAAASAASARARRRIKPSRAAARGAQNFSWCAHCRIF